MEIYNEKIRDLLRHPKMGEHSDLKIHQSPNVGIYVQGLTDSPAFKDRGFKRANG